MASCSEHSPSLLIPGCVVVTGITFPFAAVGTIRLIARTNKTVDALHARIGQENSFEQTVRRQRMKFMGRLRLADFVSDTASVVERADSVQLIAAVAVRPCS
jgi:hypothetical protein